MADDSSTGPGDRDPAVSPPEVAPDKASGDAPEPAVEPTAEPAPKLTPEVMVAPPIATSDEHDPEADRIAELMTRTRAGGATEAEREELAMYLEDRPDLARRIAEQHRESQRKVELGGTWLARVDADRRLAEAESTPLVKAERGLGLGLTIAGFALTPFAPLLSVIGLVSGAGLLTWSFTRVRLATYKDDPYRDVKK